MSANLIGCGFPLRHIAKARQFDSPRDWAAARHTLHDGMIAGGIGAILGVQGTGKTQIAVDIAHKLASEGRVCRYIKAIQMFVAIRDTFKDRGTAQEAAIAEYSKPYFLTVDNLDRTKWSDWEALIVWDIVDTRYANLRPTLFTANLSRAEFLRQIGPDLVSRMAECGNIVLADWPSFRGTT